MEVGDWITLGAVVVALAIGVASILHTRSIQKRERRERLLNEIIEWAIDVSKCGVEASFRDIIEITSIEAGEIPFAAHMVELSLRFKSMSSKNQYISKISLAFEQDLHKAVEKLIKEITLHIKLINQCRKDAFNVDRDESANKVYEHKIKLDKYVNGVVEEATKLKAKDIS